jgi:hypothetical protein
MRTSIVDERRWPLVVVHWPAIISDELITNCLADLASYYGRRHAVLHDGLPVRGMTPQQRHLFTNHIQEHEDEVRQWVVASAAVAPSPLLRGLVNLIQWVTPSPCPFRAFRTLGEAEEWLLQALRRAGLWRPSPPPTQPEG